MRHEELAAFWCVRFRVMLSYVLQPRQKGDTVRRAGGRRGCYKPAPYTKSLLCRGSPQVTHIHTHSRSPPHLQKPARCRFQTNKTGTQEKIVSEKSQEKNKNRHKASILVYNVPLFPKAVWGGLGKRKQQDFSNVQFTFIMWMLMTAMLNNRNTALVFSRANLLGKQIHVVTARRNWFFRVHETLCRATLVRRFNVYKKHL